MDITWIISNPLNLEHAINTGCHTMGIGRMSLIIGNIFGVHNEFVKIS
jgi:hypothetical protein